jgi:hypothetical protein
MSYYLDNTDSAIYARYSLPNPSVTKGRGRAVIEPWQLAGAVCRPDLGQKDAVGTNPAGCLSQPSRNHLAVGQILGQARSGTSPKAVLTAETRKILSNLIFHFLLIDTPVIVVPFVPTPRK